MELFDVKWSPAGRTLLISMAGFWSDEAVQQFKHVVADHLSGDRRPFDIIADLSALMAQSSRTVIAQSDVIASLSSAGLRRLLVVGASPLLRNQVRRAAAPLTAEFVETASDALDRLNERRTALASDTPTPQPSSAKIIGD